jgi:hypothetical protein
MPIQTLAVRQWAELLQGEQVVAVLDADEQGPYGPGMVVLQLANGEELGICAAAPDTLAFGRRVPG